MNGACARCSVCGKPRGSARWTANGGRPAHLRCALGQSAEARDELSASLLGRAARKRKPAWRYTEVEVAECEHGVAYRYRWAWREDLGETEEDSEPEIVEAADCGECYPTCTCASTGIGACPAHGDDSD